MTPIRRHAAPRRNAAFTLVELLVVLVILTALTTVAVQSIDGFQDQAHYEASQRGMAAAEDAVVGAANLRDPGGAPLISGFVSDLGRLPKALLIDGKLAVQELWDNPGGLIPFGLRHATHADAPEIAVADEDAEIYVPCGWRGPYLRLGIGQTEFRDGWGNAFDLLRKDRGDAVAGDEICILRSRGVDKEIGAAASNDYREDLYLNFVSDAFAPPAYPAVAALDRVHASPVQVTVANPDASGGNIVIRYFGPDPATAAGGIKVLSSALLPVSGTNPAVYTFTDPAITTGTRIFRAYQINGGVTIRKSDVTRAVLPAGGKQLDLMLR